MRPDKQRQAFERYRSEGDVRALAQVFDAVAPELLQVARHLEGGGEAEDLVQSTFLTAIQRAASYDATRPLLPWLLGILVNQAHLARRRRGRLVPTDEESLLEGSSEDASPQSQEFVAAVAQALRQMPETYREVLVAHLREGKKPGEIAAELGRPPGTVRAQLHRGLRLLRRALPAGFALAWLATLLLPPALAAARREVLAAARARRGTCAQPFVPTPGALRALAGVLVLALAWWLWPARAQPLPDETTPRTAHAPAAGERAVELEPGAASGREDARPPQTVAIDEGSHTAAGRGELLVRVTRADGVRPVPGVDLTLIPWGEPRWWAHVEHATSDERGEALFVDLAPGRSGVHPDGGQQLRTTVLAGRRTLAELRLPPAVRIEGRVLAPSGAGANGARVELFARADDARPRAVIECASDGRFVLPEVDPGQWIAAAQPGAAAAERVALERFTLAGACDEELLLRLEPAREPLELALADEHGAAIAGARIEIRSLAAHAPGWRASGELARRVCAVTAQSDARGLARFDEFPRERLQLVVRAVGCALLVRTLEPNAAGRLELALVPGATLRGRVTTLDANGARLPADGASVALEGSEALLSTRADARGEFVLEGLPAGTQSLVARAAGCGPPLLARLELVGGASREWEARVAPERTIEGRVVGPNGRPVQIWLVRALPLEAEPPAGEPLAATLEDRRDAVLLRCWTDAQGSFRVPCGDEGKFRLELCPRGRWQRAAIATLAPVEAGAREITFEARTSPPALRGTLLLPADGAAPFAEVFALPTGCSGLLRTDVDPGTGRFELIGASAGEWRLYARRSRGPLRMLGTRRLEADTRELGTWNFAEAQTLAAPELR